jgi:hypothetical protein
VRLYANMEDFTQMLKVYLETAPYKLEDILIGKDAWTVAHNCGLVDFAYSISRDVTDAHIQTALEKLMPNAVFKDAKRY